MGFPCHTSNFVVIGQGVRQLLCPQTDRQTDSRTDRLTDRQRTPRQKWSIRVPGVPFHPDISKTLPRFFDPNTILSLYFVYGESNTTSHALPGAVFFEDCTQNVNLCDIVTKTRLQ